ncbi:hypothetical protein EJN92_12320 [Undibacterium parvum]|uniref:Uncharacterized protein n=1 Tax=Undibacterium parvum TaxID=401471 RepID=A0A3Q9BS26_9BURK|nr:hypothetical protein EJN92_12320 [Undibacterium parvum]
MKKIFIGIALLTLISGVAFAKGGGGHSSVSHVSSSPSSNGSHSVNGYVKKDGTYVAPSHATNPNRSKADNWSSKGNTNPHTGKDGTKDPEIGK